MGKISDWFRYWVESVEESCRFGCVLSAQRLAGSHYTREAHVSVVRLVAVFTRVTVCVALLSSFSLFIMKFFFFLMKD